MRSYKSVVAIGITLFIFNGCTEVGPNTQAGTAIGAASGAVLGGIIGGSGRDMAIGAALGAVAVGAIGYNMDKQANDIARSLGTGVNNDPLAYLDPNQDLIVSNNGKYVKIMFRDPMMFASASARLQPNARYKVQKVGQLLANYPQTVVGVAGFTDNQGGYEYNLDLSQRRAATVANLLSRNGYPRTKGCSFDKAIAPNNSARNRALNRRVEVYLYANQSNMTNPCR